MVVTSTDKWSAATTPPPPPPAPIPMDAEGLPGLSLHHKGILVLIALGCLIALLCGLVLAYRNITEQDFDRLEQARRTGRLAAELAQTQALALGEVGSQLGMGADGMVETGAIERQMALLVVQAQALAATGGGDVIDTASLNRARVDLVHRADRVALLALRSQLQAGVDALARQSQAREALAVTQVARVHERGRAVAVTLATVALLGTALIGVVLVFFFARLSADIGRLRTRAMAVVAGDRQAQRTIDRDDELGELGAAIDATVAALAAREGDLEIERRNAFHREKMATIGALAAGVLNDIGNPIAAIDGFARAMRDERDAGALKFDNALCDPDHILTQTSRLQFITQQIAQLAAPPSSQPQLLSLNDVARTALLLAHFDPRVSGFQIESQFDPQLPAVDGIGDQLVQVVLNLLVNAADATRAQPERPPRIVLTTEHGSSLVRLSIVDNGCGMDAQTLARAFDPLFTTKPAGQGTGLGLPMCREIAQRHGGSLELTSVAGTGSRATLELPLTPSASS